MTPKKRALRTLLQAIVATCVAIPAIVAKFNLPAETAAQITGIAAGLVVLVSALQNAFELKGESKPTDES